jgi:hypothetical protein
MWRLLEHDLLAVNSRCWLKMLAPHPCNIDPYWAKSSLVSEMLHNCEQQTKNTATTTQCSTPLKSFRLARAKLLHFLPGLPNHHSLYNLV